MLTSYNHYYFCIYDIFFSVDLFVLWRGVVEFYIHLPIRNIRTESFTPLLSLFQHPRSTSVQLLWKQTQKYWYLLFVVSISPSPTNLLNCLIKTSIMYYSLSLYLTTKIVNKLQNIGHGFQSFVTYVFQLVDPK